MMKYFTLSIYHLPLVVSMSVRAVSVAPVSIARVTISVRTVSIRGVAISIRRVSVRRLGLRLSHSGGQNESSENLKGKFYFSPNSKLEFWNISTHQELHDDAYWLLVT